MATQDLEHPAVRRGRAARQSERLARTMDTLPYLTRRLPPVEVMSTGGLEQIEANADTLLEQVGIEVLSNLRRVDQVAYMRFASVYKDFQELTDFERELGQLLEKKAPAKRHS
jgi:trimethylamine:corrinoid methyltransferase-like protein